LEAHRELGDVQQELGLHPVRAKPAEHLRHRARQPLAVARAAPSLKRRDQLVDATRAMEEARVLFLA